VGGIIGSSLLTGVVFVLVLRYRRKKKRQLPRGEGISRGTGYPPLGEKANKTYSVSSYKKYATSDDGSSTYSTDDAGFRFPPSNTTTTLQQPAPAAIAGGIQRKSISRSISGGGGVGYAVSYYGPRPSGSSTTSTTLITGTTANSGPTINNFSTNNTNQQSRPFQLGNPPRPRGGITATATATAPAPARATTTTAAAAAAAVRNLAAAGKFTLFPRPKPKPTKQNSTNRGEDDDETEEKTQQPTKQVQQATSAAPMPWSSSASGAGVGPGMGRRQPAQGFGQGKQQQGQRGSLPSLERWLREGTDVSPFSTLKKS
jgi:hypothetical protein